MMSNADKLIICDNCEESIRPRPPTSGYLGPSGGPFCPPDEEGKRLAHCPKKEKE